MAGPSVDVADRLGRSVIGVSPQEIEELRRFPSLPADADQAPREGEEVPPPGDADAPPADEERPKEITSPNRAENYEPITLEAHRLVFGDRNAAYGHPLDDFSRTAAFWTAYLGDKLVPGATVEAEDVGPMMALLKISRQRHVRKRDNMVDLAGYAETTQRVIVERERRTKLMGSGR